MKTQAKSSAKISGARHKANCEVSILYCTYIATWRVLPAMEEMLPLVISAVTTLRQGPVCWALTLTRTTLPDPVPTAQRWQAPQWAFHLLVSASSLEVLSKTRNLALGWMTRSFSPKSGLPPRWRDSTLSLGGAGVGRDFRKDGTPIPREAKWCKRFALRRWSGTWGRETTDDAS